MTYELISDRRYLMPTHFGPSLGPRQSPDAPLDDSGFETYAIMARCAADADRIEPLLPKRTTLLAPEVTVSFRYFTQIPWLAGRGYNVVTASVPVHFKGRAESLDAELMLVVWESRTEPIITGREELGMAKIYAEVPDAQSVGDRVICRAHWDGCEFARLELVEDAKAAKAKWPAPRPVINRRYMPAVGEIGKKDADYMTLQPLPAKSPLKVLESGAGAASVSFAEVTWEQMPTQFRIVNGLHALGLTGGPARWMRTLGVDNGHAVRRIA